MKKKIAMLVVMLGLCGCVEYPRGSRFKSERVSRSLFLITDTETGIEYLHSVNGGFVRLDRPTFNIEKK